ncbi:hypothetical protein HK102_009008 [Quaeritorhiza haematococci]|nr:hypothetical protein HK102_009008 [Quaeritorhiza haematococci]
MSVQRPLYVESEDTNTPASGRGDTSIAATQQHQRQLQQPQSLHTPQQEEPKPTINQWRVVMPPQQPTDYMETVMVSGSIIPANVYRAVSPPPLDVFQISTCSSIPTPLQAEQLAPQITPLKPSPELPAVAIAVPNTSISAKRKGDLSDDNATDAARNPVVIKRTKNKEAARRCRQRRTEKITELQKETTELRTEKLELALRLAVLDSEKAALLKENRELRMEKSGLAAHVAVRDRENAVLLKDNIEAHACIESLKAQLAHTRQTMSMLLAAGGARPTGATGHD